MYCNVTVQDVHVTGLLQYNSFHTISSILYLSWTGYLLNILLRVSSEKWAELIGKVEVEQVYSIEIKANFAQNLFLS